MAEPTSKGNFMLKRFKLGWVCVLVLSFLSMSHVQAENVATELQGRVSASRAQLKQSPASPAAKQNLSQVLTDWANHLLASKQTDAALQALQEAVAIEPKNGPAWFLMGDIAYLRQSRFKEALEYWGKAYPLAPEHVQKQITVRQSRAKLDQHVERGYESVASSHFDVRFEKGINRGQAEQTAQFLEAEYQKLAAELQIQPAKITVIIYGKQGFDRFSGGHDETLGLYDGRIRMSGQYMNTAYEKTVLSHELAHAFLQHAFGSSLPIWIQEGYAQYHESERALTLNEQKMEKELRDGGGWIPLKWLDRKFLQPSGLEEVTRAYLQSRMVVGHLIEKEGSASFLGFLRKVSQGMVLREAFESSFKTGWNDMEYGRF